MHSLQTIQYQDVVLISLGGLLLHIGTHMYLIWSTAKHHLWLLSIKSCKPIEFNNLITKHYFFIGN